MYSFILNIRENVFLFITFVIIATTAILGSSPCVNAGEKDFPFYPGEKLTFLLKWTIIPAGESILEVLPVETIDGVKAYHFSLTAKSNAFNDALYKVRDKIVELLTELERARDDLAELRFFNRKLFKENERLENEAETFRRLMEIGEKNG